MLFIKKKERETFRFRRVIHHFTRRISLSLSLPSSSLAINNFRIQESGKKKSREKFNKWKIFIRDCVRAGRNIYIKKKESKERRGRSYTSRVTMRNGGASRPSFAIRGETEEGKIYISTTAEETELGNYRDRN